jgi:hypothetical protein
MTADNRCFQIIGFCKNEDQNHPPSPKFRLYAPFCYKGGYMNLNSILIIMLFIASPHLGSAQIMPDSMWAFRDSINQDEKYYYDMGFCDTPVINRGCFNPGSDTGAVYPTDTGDKYDNNYINFSYRFTNGYAGFKIFWDMGMSQFNATEYSGMYLVHKGPLPGHKVQMLWVSSTGCGAPKVFQIFGEFKSSTTWKKEAIPFPADFKKTGLYELRFLVNNDDGTTSPTSGPGNLKLDDIAFIKGTMKPAAPTPVSPSNNAAGVSVTPAIMWSGSSGTTSYSLQVATVADFSSPVVNRNNITVAAFNASGLMNHTKYYWRVNATNTAGTSDWSTPWNFTTISPVPAAPLIVFPVSGLINIPIDPVMVWHSVAYAVSYKVQVSTTPDFIMLVKYMTVLTDTSVIVTGLANGTKYYSRVNATSTGGTGNWSAAIEFTTVPANVAVLPGRFQLCSFSFDGSSRTIRYFLPGECFVSLNYYNVRGAEVASFVNQVQKPGSYSLVLPLSTWARGTYIQIYRAGSFVKKDQIVVMR